MEGTSKYPLNTHPANQPDEYVRCPYFPEHELRKSRLPYHIIKCQNNPAAPKLLVCPFNYLHRVRPEDRQEHAMLCEDKVSNTYKNKEPPSYANTRKQYFGIQEDMPQTSDGPDKTEDGEEWW